MPRPHVRRLFCVLCALAILAILYLSDWKHKTDPSVRRDWWETVWTWSPYSRNLQLLGAYLDQRLPLQTWITLIGVRWNRVTHHRLLTNQIDIQGYSVSLFTEPLPATEVQFKDEGQWHPHEYNTTVWRWGPFNLNPLPAGTNVNLHLFYSYHYYESHSLVSLEVIPPLAQLTPRYNFSICLAPLFGEISADRVQHFMEMSAALGMEHVYVYQHAAAPPVEDPQHQGRLETTLQFYAGHRTPRLASLTKLFIEPPADRGLYYWGQVTAYAHCLYRSMFESSFTLFMDLDEVLVPRPAHHAAVSPPGTAWRGLVNSLHFGAEDDQRCGLCFPMHMFLYESNDSSPWYFTHFRRNRYYSLDKCLIKPALVLDMDVHNVHSCLPGWTMQQPGSAVAVVHHYRNRSNLCDPPNDRHTWCAYETMDDTLLRYKSDFDRNMQRLQEDKQRLLVLFNVTL